jgi:hypothetical protein
MCQLRFTNGTTAGMDCQFAPDGFSAGQILEQQNFTLIDAAGSQR